MDINLKNRYFYVAYQHEKGRGWCDWYTTENQYLNIESFIERIGKKYNISGIIITNIIELNKEDHADLISTKN